MTRAINRHAGFTLIEMVVVMATIGLLLSLAVPRYMDSLARGKAQVQQKNLATMREAVDRFYGDTGRYPERLEDLVTRRYLRAIPIDPFSESPTWLVVAPKDPAQGGVYDVRAAAPGAEREADAGSGPVQEVTVLPRPDGTGERSAP